MAQETAVKCTRAPTCQKKKAVRARVVDGKKIKGPQRVRSDPNCYRGNMRKAAAANTKAPTKCIHRDETARPT